MIQQICSFETVNLLKTVTGAVSSFMVVDLPGAGDGDDDDDDGNYDANDDDGDEDDDEGGDGDEDDDAVLILLPNCILFSLFPDHPSSSITSFSSTSICSGSLIHSNTGQPACQLCFFLVLRHKQVIDCDTAEDDSIPLLLLYPLPHPPHHLHPYLCFPPHPSPSSSTISMCSA